MKRFILLAALLVFSAAGARATTVTATVVDPNGNAYANGTVAAALFTTTGLPPAPGVITSSGPNPLDGAGHFSMVLTDTSTITPAGATYQLTLCANSVNLGPGAQILRVCFKTGYLTVTGGSVDLTAQINAVAFVLGPMLNGGGGGGGGTFGPAEASVWVTTAANGGSDSNPGTQSSPRLTLEGGCEALPGGTSSPPTCGAGIVNFTGGVYGGPGGVGFQMFGFDDPNYAGGLSGWVRQTGAVNFNCVGPDQAVVNVGTTACTVLGGNNTDNWHPGLWLSRTTSVSFTGLALDYQGVNVILGFCSTHLNDGTCASQLTSFESVSTNLGAGPVTGGPGWNIGQGCFWTFVNHYSIVGNSTASAASLTADNSAAVLIGFSGDMVGSGLFSFTNGGWQGGSGIKYYEPTAFNAYLLVDGMTSTENEMEAAVWILGQGSGIVSVKNLNLSDCTMSPCLYVRNDTTVPVHLAVSGALQTASAPPTVGPIAFDTLTSAQAIDNIFNFIGNTYYVSAMQPGTVLVPEAQQASDVQHSFPPVSVQAANLVNVGTRDMSACSMCTVTTGILDPAGKTNAIQVSTSNAGNQQVRFTLSGVGGFVSGDSFGVGIWTRSQTLNGYAGAVSVEFFVNGDLCNLGGSQPGIGSITTTEAPWTHYVGVCKIVSTNGETPILISLVNSTHAIQLAYPQVIALHGRTDSEVTNAVLNMGSWDASCSAGQECDTIGPITHTPFPTGAFTLPAFSMMASGTCVVTTLTVTGINPATDNIKLDPTVDVSAIGGYAPNVGTGNFSIYPAWLSANQINVKVCNPTAGSLTAAATVPMLYHILR